MLPKKLGGRSEGSPAVVVAFGTRKPKGMPSRLGGPSEYDEEPEADEGPIDGEQAKDDAVGEIISALGGSRQSSGRLKAALEAFVYACNNTKPESEETEEEGSY